MCAVLFLVVGETSVVAAEVYGERHKEIYESLVSRPEILDTEQCPWVEEQGVSGSPSHRNRSVSIWQKGSLDLDGEVEYLVYIPCVFETARKGIGRVYRRPNTFKLVQLILGFKRFYSRADILADDELRNDILDLVEGLPWNERLAIYDQVFLECVTEEWNPDFEKWIVTHPWRKYWRIWDDGNLACQVDGDP